MIAEILRNSKARKSVEWNYASYEENSDEINKEIINKIEPYDNNLGYVAKMNAVIENLIRPDKKVKIDSVDPVSEVFGTDSHLDIDETVAEADQTQEESTEKSPIDDNDNKIKTIDSQKSVSDRRYEALMSLYRERVKKVQQKLDEEFGAFLNDPWSYPQHDDEWRSFYFDRSYQLWNLSNVVGVPINYMQAWHSHWLKRMHKLKLEKLKAAKTQFRNELCLSESSEECSQDEVDYETPTKRKKYSEYEPEVNATISYHPSNPAMTSHKTTYENDRIIFAYNIGLDHFQTGKRLTPEEILTIVNAYFNDAEQNVNGGNSLSDDDLFLLYNNFINMNFDEQEKFLSFLRCIEVSDPKRYENLKMAMRNV